MSLSDDGYPAATFLICLGLWLGSLFGAMAQIVPMQLVLIFALLSAITCWALESQSLFVTVLLFSIAASGWLGGMSGQVPFGVGIFATILLSTRFWKQSVPNMGGVNRQITTIAFIFISVGLFTDFSYYDFCGTLAIGGASDVCADPARWVHGFPTEWAGCFVSCTVNPIQFFGASIFSKFILAAAAGNYVGMIQAIIDPGAQGLVTILSVAIASVFLLLGMGIGGSFTLFGSGASLRINDAGTRFFQSYGVALIVWIIAYSGFGGWLPSAFGGNFMFIFGLALLTMFASIFFYGAYQQGKDIAH